MYNYIITKQTKYLYSSRLLYIKVKYKMDEKLTLIQVEKTTREKLQQVRITKRESYNEVILRLLKYKDETNNKY